MDDSALIECAEPSQRLDLLEVADELGLSIETEFRLEWWVNAVSGADTVQSEDRFTLLCVPNEIPGLGDDMPVEFGLKSVYPSPFNSRTTVRFGVDRPVRVRLLVYDLQGRQVCTLFDRTPEVGYHRVAWDAGRIPSGIYVLRLEAGGRRQTMKVALIR